MIVGTKLVASLQRYDIFKDIKDPSKMWEKGIKNIRFIGFFYETLGGIWETIVIYEGFSSNLRCK